MRQIRPISERFWEKVDQSGDCWEWTAYRDPAGYGRITVRGQSERASRVAWELEHGALPADACVLHRCDNRGCVRPDHLFLGNRRDNIDDMVLKGRQRAPQGDEHWTRQHPERVLRGDQNGAHVHRERVLRGDDHPFRRKPELVARGSRTAASKLTEADVEAIRREHVPRKVTAKMLAEKYGVHEWTIYAVLQRRNWKHV